MSIIKSIKAYWNKSRQTKTVVLSITGVAIILMTGVVTSGVVWHNKPSFCATCHTPMSQYVEGYQSGDKALLITQHANSEDKLVCLDCHEPTLGDQAVQSYRWVTGHYYFPLDEQKFGTRSFCLSPDCHIESEIIEATKDYNDLAPPFNQHDPRHGKQQCYNCHTMHGQSVLTCNQCHNLKLPDGWIAPKVTGEVVIDQ